MHDHSHCRAMGSICLQLGQHMVLLTLCRPQLLPCCQLWCLRRPLLVVGKGAAHAQSDEALRSFVEASGLPFLGTAMGRGVVPDSHSACVQPARSLALSQADVAIVVGAR